MCTQANRKKLIFAFVMNALSGISSALAYYVGNIGFSRDALYFNIAACIILAKYVFKKTNNIEK